MSSNVLCCFNFVRFNLVIMLKICLIIINFIGDLSLTNNRRCFPIWCISTLAIRESFWFHHHLYWCTNELLGYLHGIMIVVVVLFCKRGNHFNFQAQKSCPTDIAQFLIMKTIECSPWLHWALIVEWRLAFRQILRAYFSEEKNRFLISTRKMFWGTCPDLYGVAIA